MRKLLFYISQNLAGNLPSVFGDNLPSKIFNLEKILTYLFLFKKQFDD